MLCSFVKIKYSVIYLHLKKQRLALKMNSTHVLKMLNCFVSLIHSNIIFLSFDLLSKYSLSIIEDFNLFLTSLSYFFTGADSGEYAGKYITYWLKFLITLTAFIKWWIVALSITSQHRPIRTIFVNTIA